MEKKCSKCKLIKSVSEFGKSGKHKYGETKYRSQCKQCCKEYTQEYFFKNREKIYESKKAHKNNWKQQVVEFHGNKCAQCKQTFPVCVYDFHHLDPSQKEFQIAAASSYEKAIEESKKCVMLCANCHRIVHHGQEADKLFEWEWLDIIKENESEPLINSMNDETIEEKTEENTHDVD